MARRAVAHRREAPSVVTKLRPQDGRCASRAVRRRRILVGTPADRLRRTTADLTLMKMTHTNAREWRSPAAAVTSVRRETLLVLTAVCLAGGARVAPAQAGAQELDARIARLRRSFDCVDVQTTSGFVCSMKDGLVGSLSRKRIEPVVTSGGTIFLRSVYRDRDWIYHDHVIVRVGDQEYVSDALPATSPDVTRRETRRQSSSDRRRGRYDEDRYVSESVRYRGGSDNGIVRAVAEAGDATVTMRLAGGPRVFDKTLSRDEKRSFAEAMELATLLRRRAMPATGDTSIRTVDEGSPASGRTPRDRRR